MTLLERLKPHYKKILERENLEFPTLVNVIVEDLEQVKYVHLLLYKTVMNMNLLFDTDVSPYELFEEI